MGKVVTDKRTPRILLAEDELLVAAEIEAMLVELGCEVVGPLATVAEVERLTGAERLDCALLDVKLRGQQVFSAVPAPQARRIPVVLSSGYRSPALFRRNSDSCRCWSSRTIAPDSLPCSGRRAGFEI